MKPKFEAQFESDINDWFKGVDPEDLRHGDTGVWKLARF